MKSVDGNSVCNMYEGSSGTLKQRILWKLQEFKKTGDFDKFLKFCTISLLSILLNFIFFQSPQFAADAHIYRGEIKSFNKEAHNFSLKYPVTIINNLYYIPLKNEFLTGIGLKVSDFAVRSFDNYAIADGIDIRSIERTDDIPPEIFGECIRVNATQPLIATIRINNRILRNNHPTYLIDGVPYLCLDDSNDFSVDSTDILWRGIRREEEQILECYNTFEHIPQSEFVRDQGSTQKCWAYAACSLLEIKIALSEGNFLNLSEDHLIEHCPVPTNAISGGNRFFSFSYLTKLLGPVSENDADSQLLGYYVLEYSEAYGAKEIKKAIKKNGAILTSVYYGPEISKYYDKTKYSYYHNDSRHRPTHELILVGWDDRYPKENFKQPAPGDGAFIAMNSFGENFGDKGIFYISYHDDIATQTGVSIDKYGAHAGDFRVISKDKGGVTHYETLETLSHKKDIYAIQKLSVDEKSKIRGVGVYSNGRAIVSAYYSKEMPSSESELIFLGDTYFENAGFKMIESYQNLQIEDSFYIVLKYHSSKTFAVPIEAPYPGILYNVASEPETSFLAYLINGKLIATPLENIKQDGTFVLRLLIFSDSQDS